jgi:formate hydrogenlyase transcriptional activator
MNQSVYIDAMVDGPQQVAEASQREELLVRAARALTMSLEINEVCDAVLDAIQSVFGAATSWILLHDPETNRLRTMSSRGVGSAVFRDLALATDVGIVGLAFTSRQVVFVPEVKEEDRWYDPARVQGSGLASVFMVPLVHRDEAIGVIGLDSPRFSARRAPTPTDRARLEAFGAQAAIAVANARLYDASERDRRKLRALVQERRKLRGQVDHLETAIRIAGAFGDIVGEDKVFEQVLEQARLVAPADTSVLLLGETGTGKELLARYVHARSGRAKRPFVAVNCAALPEALVESELFGHEKGAFTGALCTKPGKFEIAHRGTLFLDEVGDLPLEAQAKLLRVLQDGQVQRVGSTRSIGADVRVIAATNQDLELALGTHRFRADLFYRLNVFPIRIPPLRDRPGDIALLARHFLDRFTSRLGRPPLTLAPAAVDRLKSYHWPGNVRELQNVIERAVILSSGQVIDDDVIAVRPQPRLALDRSAASESMTTLAAIERRAILAALETTNWCISGPRGAACLLGLKPTTLHARMKKHGIHRPTPVTDRRK